ncbi:hypothetical protein AVEN_167490-1 [Araneus ventricosus]|uniref:Uncharacterized protein n=1 Tax=Araneus ventricosus TaxID=182803 RepID=A0A4Y2IET1_ARAVE|nr:hypothetical protein AVEN_167490-1 [Araneus ventricosus]
MAALAWRGNLERGVPAQVSSSSSDRGSKLRGPSQNSPRVASKRDVNITKTQEILYVNSEGTPGESLDMLLPTRQIRVEDIESAVNSRLKNYKN